MPHVHLPICSLQASAALEAPLLTMRDIEPPLYHCSLKSLQDVTHTVSCFHTESFQLCSLLRAYHVFASLCNLLCTVLGACLTLRLCCASGSSSSSGKPHSKQEESKQASDAGSSSNKPAALPANGYTLVSQALYRMGIRNMYGVVGIPVTELASAAQVGGSAKS